MSLFYQIFIFSPCNTNNVVEERCFWGGINIGQAVQGEVGIYLVVEILMKLSYQILGHFVLSDHKPIKIIFRHRSSQDWPPAYLNELSVGQDRFLLQ